MKRQWALSIIFVVSTILLFPQNAKSKPGNVNVDVKVHVKGKKVIDESHPKRHPMVRIASDDKKSGAEEGEYCGGGIFGLLRSCKEGLTCVGLMGGKDGPGTCRPDVKENQCLRKKCGESCKLGDGGMGGGVCSGGNKGFCNSVDMNSCSCHGCKDCGLKCGEECIIDDIIFGDIQGWCSKEGTCDEDSDEESLDCEHENGKCQWKDTDGNCIDHCHGRFPIGVNEDGEQMCMCKGDEC